MDLTDAEEIDELKRKITLLGEPRVSAWGSSGVRENGAVCLAEISQLARGGDDGLLRLTFVTRADGDKKAYSESSKWAIQQNKALIFQLRQENKLFRAKLSKKMKVSITFQDSLSLFSYLPLLPSVPQTDDDVIFEAFQAHNMPPPAELRGLPGEVCIYNTI